MAGRGARHTERVGNTHTTLGRTFSQLLEGHVLLNAQPIESEQEGQTLQWPNLILKVPLRPGYYLPHVCTI